MYTDSYGLSCIGTQIVLVQSICSVGLHIITRWNDGKVCWFNRWTDSDLESFKSIRIGDGFGIKGQRRRTTDGNCGTDHPIIVWNDGPGCKEVHSFIPIVWCIIADVASVNTNGFCVIPNDSRTDITFKWEFDVFNTPCRSTVQINGGPRYKVIYCPWWFTF